VEKYQRGLKEGDTQMQDNTGDNQMEEDVAEENKDG